MAIGCLSAVFFALPALTMLILGPRQVWMSFFGSFPSSSSFLPSPLALLVPFPLRLSVHFSSSFVLALSFLFFFPSDPVGTFFFVFLLLTLWVRFISSSLLLSSFLLSSDPAGTFVVASVGVV